ncbi:hypothetical protein AAFC00_004605 [Neodothiora populina]|uniref:6-methylsalicylate decarboxylase n=1 Tax=Neodothiora populina TaxID=2781224 RepID=A0ABR3P2W6_9PEZI
MANSRIDVHAHFLPPDYFQACLDNGYANPDGMPALPKWSTEAHLDSMSRIGISKSILSISSPGTYLKIGDKQLASTVTRYCNNYAASLKKQYPSKFGFWASLPLPDIELALAEIPQAIEDGCDGFAVKTNHQGHYLGDPLFDPVFEEFNKRRAIVFIHPTSPCIACGDGKEPIKAAPLHANFPNPMIEFFFDTARCVTNLFLSGTVARYPDITYVIPHAGGAMPPILPRFTGFSTLVPGPWTGVAEKEARQAFNKQFYFDLAGFPFSNSSEDGKPSGQLVGLVQGCGVSSQRLMYGSDFPFTSVEGVNMLAGQMNTGVKKMFSDDEIEAIYHGNAQRLLDRRQSV